MGGCREEMVSGRGSVGCVNVLAVSDQGESGGITEGKLELMELGRALYHLAHRRGFLSNRKTDRQEKEVGPVKEGI